MSLMDAMMDSCYILNKAKVPDGQGGYSVTYTEGAQIKVAIVLNTSITAKIAEAEGFTNTFTLTTHKDDALEYHDIIKRISDGLILRVTNDALNFPVVASYMLNDYTQVTAEKWRLE